MLLSVSMSDLQKIYNCSYYTCNKNCMHIQLLALYYSLFFSFTVPHFAPKTIIIYYKLTLDWV